MKLIYKLLQSGLLLIILISIGWTTESSAQTIYKAVLSGSHEVPPVTSSGTGELTVTLDGNILTVEGSFNGLTSAVDTDIAGGAHIHRELPGRNGSIEFPLVIDLEPDNTAGTFHASDNEFELSTDQIEALEKRMLYINVHTLNFGSGEIRGQILPESDAYFRVNLSGTNEVPPVLSRANGAATGELDGDSLIISGSFQSLSSDLTGAHIHMQLSGRNAGVVFPLVIDAGEDGQSGVFLAENNRFELDSDELSALLERRFYINVHSSNHTAGEIRGQIVPQVTTTLVANLSGSAEESRVITPGSGSVVVELDENMLTLTGSFQNLGSNYTASHLHVAPPGRSGGVTIPLVATTDPTNLREGIYEAELNTFQVDEHQVEQLLTRNLYINVHTLEHTGGEIRGQLLGESHAFFTTRFAGIHEVPPVNSSGNGGVEIEFKGNRLVMVGSFNNLSSDFTAAHFHTGAPYESGGVILGVNPTSNGNGTNGNFLIENNHFQEGVTEDFVTQLFNENLYINIHSQNFGPGELRGQVLGAPNAFPGTAEIELPEDEAVIVIEGDSNQHFDISWSSAEDPDDNTVVYIWQASLDESFPEPVFNLNIGMETHIEVSYEEAEEFLDEQEVESGESITLYHRVLASDGSLYRISDTRTFTLERGVGSDAEQEIERPIETQLHQNYPNPFNPTTEITFSIGESGPVELYVYNMLGQRVVELKNEVLTPGNYSVNFNASNLASGIYIYHLSTDDRLLTRKMTLIK